MIVVEPNEKENEMSTKELVEKLRAENAKIEKFLKNFYESRQPKKV